MVRYQYASTPTPPPPTVAKGAGSITASKAGTKSLWLTCRNQVGNTLFSNRVDVAVVAGDSISVTLPSSLRQPASQIFEIQVVLAESTDPATGCIVATYPGFIDGALSPLPHTITLNQDEQLEVNKSVASSANLPTTNLLHGMRRYITDEGAIKTYNGYAAVPGWEVVYPNIFNPYILDTTTSGGADIDISNITDTSVILIQDYQVGSGTSAETIFWLVNDGSTDIGSGTRIRTAVALDELDVDSDDFIGKLQIEIGGYVNLSTGSIDTTGLDDLVGGYFDYQGDRITNLRLPKNLPAGQGVIVKIRGDFTAEMLNGLVPRGAVLGFAPRLDANPSVYNPAGEVTGDVMLPGKSGTYRRFIPDGYGLSGKVTEGSGIINTYGFRDLPEDAIPALTTNTDNQNLIITVQGVVYPAATVPGTSGLRAIAGTLNGAGLPSAWSAPIALDGTKLLSITLSHPGMIRVDYPDVIQGMIATLNANKARVYVRPTGGGTITSYDILLANSSGTETVQVGASAGASGATLSAQLDFGLFAVNVSSTGTTAGTSVFTAGNYEVAVAYLYEGTISRITHDPVLGCVPELEITLVEATNQLKYWREPVATESDLNLLTNKVDGEIRLIEDTGIIKRWSAPGESWVAVSGGGLGGATQSGIGEPINVRTEADIDAATTLEQLKTEVKYLRNSLLSVRQTITEMLDVMRHFKQIEETSSTMDNSNTLDNNTILAN